MAFKLLEPPASQRMQGTASRWSCSRSRAQLSQPCSTRRPRPSGRAYVAPAAFLVHTAVSGAAAGGKITTDSLRPNLTGEGEIGFRRDLEQAYRTDRSAILGQGAFGQVYRGWHRGTGSSVAVKTMPKVRGKLSRSSTLGKISREVCLMQKVQSCTAGVPQLIDCFEDDEQVHLVTELCPGGDLKQYTEMGGPLDEEQLALVAAEVLKIVRACHSVNILYSDIKPANICLQDADGFRSKTRFENNIKLVDFGCSQQLIGGKTRSTKRSGTLGFLAPEVFNRDHGHKAEVWSTGVNLYWLFAQRLPFWSCDQVPKTPTLDDVMLAVTQLPIPYDYGPWLTMSPLGLDFVQRCLTRPEDQRMSVDEALSHPWLAPVVNSTAGSRAPVMSNNILNFTGAAAKAASLA